MLLPTLDMSRPTSHTVAAEETTPRSSFTYTERHSFDNSANTSHVPTLHSPLDKEIERDELNFERYGGDDIHDPPAKTQAFPSPSKLPPASATTTLDSDMVAWEGPDDPENPQNWSIRYKWMITVVCIIMTVNVFVDIVNMVEFC